MRAFKNIILCTIVLVLITSIFSDQISKKSEINYTNETADNAVYLHVFNALIFSDKDTNFITANLSAYKTNIIMSSA